MIEWWKPRYPGDAVRMEVLRRGNMLGDIRIQQYDRKVRVSQFLPGHSGPIHEGDTPKWEPDRASWIEDKAQADALFELWIGEAHEAGWQDYKPKGD